MTTTLPRLAQHIPLRVSVRLACIMCAGEVFTTSKSRLHKAARGAGEETDYNDGDFPTVWYLGLKPHPLALLSMIQSGQQVRLCVPIITHWDFELNEVINLIEKLTKPCCAWKAPAGTSSLAA